MTWTVDDSGTLTSTGSGTEDIIVDGSSKGITNATYVLKVDLADMVNADIVEIRMYTKVLTGGTLRVAWKAAFAHIPVTKVVLSPPVPSDFALKCTITQHVGTASLPWSLLRV